MKSSAVRNAAKVAKRNFLDFSIDFEIFIAITVLLENAWGLFMEKALRGKVIKVYPARIYLVCAQLRMTDVKRLACSLLRCHKGDVVSSKLIEDKKYYLSLRVRTSSAQRMLCDICENSERVYIGYDYDAVFSEHGRIIIAQNAIETLCQE